MSKKNTDQLINVAKEAFQNKPYVAFLGKAFYGKTVVSTLLYDALFHHFIPQNFDKFSAGVVKGFDTVYQTHKMMIEGKFPPPNLPGPIPEIAIEISNVDVLGGKITLLLRDMSGEDHETLLLTEKEPTELVLSILSEGTSPNSNSYGPFSYLVFAKLYVILIDCSKIDTWRFEDIRFSQLVKSIRDMKIGINEAPDGKTTASVAILLTKADTLKPEFKDEPAEDLIKKNAPQLYLRLTEYVQGSKGFFKLGVDVEQATPSEFTKIQEEYAKTREIERAEAERQIMQEIEKVKIDARNAATSAGLPPDQVEAAVNTSIQERRATLSSIGKTRSDSSKDKQIEQKKLKTPISYTSGEYISFISWIIKTMSKK